MKGQCCACGYNGLVDRAHIKSRGAGGSWDEDNLLPLCRKCHSMQHSIGWPRFAKKFINVELKLKEQGWEIGDLFGRERLVRKNV